MVLKRVLFASGSYEWETPQDVFDDLHREFAFTLDASASAENAKLDHFYTKDDDALTKSWDGRVWCNPPYGRIVSKFLSKAVDEITHNDRCEVVVFLLPARTCTRWFHDFVWDERGHHPRTAVSVRFLRGRLKFGGSSSSAPFPSMVVVMQGMSV